MKSIFGCKTIEHCRIVYDRSYERVNLIYGNNQLKLIVEKNPDMEILISKNKVADFKQWLNQ